MRRKRWITVGTLVLAGLSLSACAEVEEAEKTGYEPATLEAVKGTDDVKRVTFTAEGAERVGLESARVTGGGQTKVVPYAALIYDAEGKTYVYTSPERLSFLRQEVQVDRIEDDRVLLSEGPATGTAVVTTGAAEVYGTELEVPEG